MNRNDYTKEECWLIADALAEDRLPLVNENCAPVESSDTFYARYIKRAIDVVVSGVALVITSPINLALMVGTAIDVGRPLIFKQTRIGKDGKEFTLYKFRNMKNTKDAEGNLLPAAQRVTRFGRFVRKVSLDELLNFWSIFKGDMSLIGPRPLLPEYTHRYSKRHIHRLDVRPGLECPPMNGVNGLQTWNDQFENDVEYVESLSLSADAKCAVNLVRYAFDSSSASSRGGAKRTAFMGYDEDGKAISVDDVSDSYARAVLSEVKDA